MGRIILGIFILALFAAAAVGGVWLLYQNEGGGVPFTVTFPDAKNLEPNARVVYRDQMVGRVITVRQKDGSFDAECRLSSEHSGVLRTGSRVWIQDNLGGAFICFDSPPKSGDVIAPGARLVGISARPEPEAVEPKPRKLDARPVWLCEVRAVAGIKEGDLRREERRKSAAAVVRSGDRVLLLAPAWVKDFGGEVLELNLFVEFPGGETRTATVIETRGALALIGVASVADNEYRGGVAKLWPEPLATGQGLALVNFDGDMWTAEMKNSELATGAKLDGGSLALVDGVNLCGFALPHVGERLGARWVPIAGAAELLRAH